MKIQGSVSLLFALGLLAPLSASGCRSGAAAKTPPAEQLAPPVEEQAPRSATLYANDFLRSSLSFADGSFGAILQDGEVRNRDSEIEYGNYEPGAFSVGIQGGQTGRIVDLGHWRELSEAHGYREVVGGGVGFMSIRRGGTEVLIAEAQAKAGAQLLRGARGMLSAPTRDLDSAAPEVGHVYLVHLEDRNDPAFERLVKLLVTEHRPGESVTFLWQEL
jgi:hypothetical protein